MSELRVIALAIGALAFACGVVFYLRMMASVPPEVAREQAARLRIRHSLLCFAAPELFVGVGARERRRYIACLLVFAGALVLAAAVGGA